MYVALVLLGAGCWRSSGAWEQLLAVDSMVLPLGLPLRGGGRRGEKRCFSAGKIAYIDAINKNSRSRIFYQTYIYIFRIR